MAKSKAKIFDNFNDDLLSAQKFVKRLREEKGVKLSVHTLREWRFNGYIPEQYMVKLGPKLVFYRWQSLLRFLMNGETHEYRKN